MQCYLWAQPDRRRVGFVPPTCCSQKVTGENTSSTQVLMTIEICRNFFIFRFISFITTHGVAQHQAPQASLQVVSILSSATKHRRSSCQGCPNSCLSIFRTPLTSTNAARHHRKFPSCVPTGPQHFTHSQVFAPLTFLRPTTALSHTRTAELGARCHVGFPGKVSLKARPQSRTFKSPLQKISCNTNAVHVVEWTRFALRNPTINNGNHSFRSHELSRDAIREPEVAYH